MDTENKEIHIIRLIIVFIEKAFEIKGLAFSKDEKKKLLFSVAEELGISQSLKDILQDI